MLALNRSVLKERAILRKRKANKKWVGKDVQEILKEIGYNEIQIQGFYKKRIVE